jgi:hypothetical protein
VARPTPIVSAIWRGLRQRARLLRGGTAVREASLKHARAILAGNATKVAGTIRRAATTQRLDPPKRTNADTCATYLTNKAPFLDYPTALTGGWPIATGVIEGTCRHLVKDRMDITGARWGLAGAEAILKLRAIFTNKRLRRLLDLPPRARTPTHPRLTLRQRPHPEPA